MPKLDGFEVLELLDEPPAVVFAPPTTSTRCGRSRCTRWTTCSSRSAASGSPRRSRACASASPRRRAPPRRPAPSGAKLAAAARPPGQFVERLLVRDGAKVHVIPVERLDYLEAQDDYVAIHADGKTWLKHDSARRPRRGARSCAVRAHPPLVRGERRAHRAARAVRQGQPGRDPGRRPPAARQPRRLRAAARADVGRPALGSGHGPADTLRLDARSPRSLCDLPFSTADLCAAHRKGRVHERLSP